MLARDFSEVGKNYRRWGAEGNREGEFSYPARICAFRDNTKEEKVAVADSCNNRIQILSAKGDFELQLGKKGRDNGQFLSPTAVAVSAHHDCIAVVDNGNHRVQCFNKYGKVTTSSMVGTKGNGVGELSNPTSACWIGADGRELLVVR
jgi:tripartite motif-containing protein 2/3